jgi:hypothetical protein
MRNMIGIRFELTMSEIRKIAFIKKDGILRVGF